MPKQDTKFKTQEIEFEKKSHLSINPFLGTNPFKGERISVMKLDGVISDSHNTSLFRDITSSNFVLDLILKATKDTD